MVVLELEGTENKRLHINQWYEGEEAIYTPTAIYTNFYVYTSIIKPQQIDTHTNLLIGETGNQFLARS